MLVYLSVDGEGMSFFVMHLLTIVVESHHSHLLQYGSRTHLDSWNGGHQSSSTHIGWAKGTQQFRRVRYPSARRATNYGAHLIHISSCHNPIRHPACGESTASMRSDPHHRKMHFSPYLLLPRLHMHTHLTSLIAGKDQVTCNEGHSQPWQRPPVLQAWDLLSPSHALRQSLPLPPVQPLLMAFPYLG